MIRVGPKVHTDADLDMTSLLDMVFILLIFFVIASSFVIKGLTFDLPSAKTSKSISGHIVEIELNKEGNYVCDGVPTYTEARLAKISMELLRDLKKDPDKSS